MRKYFWGIFAFVFILGCQTVPRSEQESSKEALGAMTTVTESVTGKKLSEQDLKKLNQQIRTDQEAQSAVQTLTNSMTGQGAAIKYCPVDGERFAAHITECPTHHVGLKGVEP